MVDINGDGVPDIAVAFDGLEYFFLGNGDGTFVAPTTTGFVVGFNGVYAFGDFYSHGIPDIFTSFGDIPRSYLVLKNNTQ